MLVAAIGVVRLPDIMMRMHATTKAGTVGLGLVFLAVALFFGHVDTSMRAAIAVAFIFLTAPVGAHVIGRAAYWLGTPLWKGTIVDELRSGLEDEGRNRAG